MTAMSLRQEATAGRPRPITEWPFISVVVPVRNEEACIAGVLGQLLSQNYDPERFEVLVADGGSTDATPDVVRRLERDHRNLRLLDNPGRLSSAGRNAGIRAARGDVVVIVDGHCELDGPDHLAKLADAFARSGADCVGRPQPLDVSHASPLQRAIAAARSSRLGHHPDSFIYAAEERFVRPQSVAVAYRREVFEIVGLFDEGFDACEDVEFNHRVERAGIRCFFTPAVGVRYRPRTSLAGLFRQMVRYGRGRVRLLRKHPETFTAPGFVPAAFLAGLAAGPALSLLLGWLAAGYLGGVCLYALVVAAACLGVARNRRELRLLPWLPLVFFTIHAGAGAGILSELVAGGRRPAAASPVQLQEQLS